MSASGATAAVVTAPADEADRTAFFSGEDDVSASRSVKGDEGG
jgi:hypothetical protein